MILFFVGIVEMAIAAYWTRAVTKAEAAATGVVTAVNFVIWYFVIRQVVENIDNWQAIVPYGIGCTLGASLGTLDLKKTIASMRKTFARMTAPPKTAVRRPGLPVIE